MAPYLAADTVQAATPLRSAICALIRRQARSLHRLADDVLRRRWLHFRFLVGHQVDRAVLSRPGNCGHVTLPVIVVQLAGSSWAAQKRREQQATRRSIPPDADPPASGEDCIC